VPQKSVLQRSREKWLSGAGASLRNMSGESENGTAASRSKDGVPSWNGEAASFVAYEEAARLWEQGLVYNKRYTAAPRRMAELTGAARRLVAGKPAEEVAFVGGVKVLLDYLSRTLGKPQVNEVTDLLGKYKKEIREVYECAQTGAATLQRQWVELAFTTEDDGAAIHEPSTAPLPGAVRTLTGMAMIKTIGLTIRQKMTAKMAARLLRGQPGDREPRQLGVGTAAGPTVAQELRNQFPETELRRKDQGRRSHAFVSTEDAYENCEAEAQEDGEEFVNEHLNDEGAAMLAEAEDEAQQASAWTSTPHTQGIAPKNQEHHGNPRLAEIDKNNQPLFGFGNSTEGVGPTILLSIDALRSLGAIVDFREDLLVLTAINAHVPVTAYQAQKLTSVTKLPLSPLRSMDRLSRPELVLHLRALGEESQENWTRMEIKQRIQEITEETPALATAVAHKTPLETQMAQLSKSSRKKSTLPEYLENELHIEVTDMDTIAAMQRKASNKILQECPVHGADAMGRPQQHTPRALRLLVEQGREDGGPKNPTSSSATTPPRPKARGYKATASSSVSSSTAAQAPPAVDPRDELIMKTTTALQDLKEEVDQLRAERPREEILHDMGYRVAVTKGCSVGISFNVEAAFWGEMSWPGPSMNPMPPQSFKLTLPRYLKPQANWKPVGPMPPDIIVLEDNKFCIPRDLISRTEGWSQYFGYPRALRVDPTGVKELMTRLCDFDPELTPEMALSEAITTFNHRDMVSGFTPAQQVIGRGADDTDRFVEASQGLPPGLLMHDEVLVIKGAEKRTSIEHFGLKEAQRRTDVSIRWVHSEAQLANSLTKQGGHHELEMFYKMAFRWRIVEDEQMMSAVLVIDRRMAAATQDQQCRDLQ
ncbi:GIP, partial [Symbiodinium sp. CCMP2456]